MATNMSRRVFLKCAGAAALAVTASGIFAGCSPSGGGSKDTVYGVGESTQINGVNVKLLGYQQGLASEIAGNYADKTLIAICFGIENQSDRAIQMGNTTQDELAKVWKAIKNNDFDSLSEREFVVAAKDRKLGHAAIGYSRMTNAGIGDILGAGFMAHWNRRSLAASRFLPSFPMTGSRSASSIRRTLPRTRPATLC